MKSPRIGSCVSIVTSALALFGVVAAISSPAKADPSASQFLAEHLGRRTLACDVSGWDPSVILVRARPGQVAVRAKEASRGAVYSVDAVTFRGEYIGIVLNNNIDGPLATAVLVIPAGGITELDRGGPNAMGVKARVFYRESYNGTKDSFAAICHF